MPRRQHPLTIEQIQAIVDTAADPANLTPAGPGAHRLGRLIASDMADSFTEDDWRYGLNRLPPARAARTIRHRPASDRQWLLDLIEDPTRRRLVEQHLTAAA